MIIGNRVIFICQDISVGLAKSESICIWRKNEHVSVSVAEKMQLQELRQLSITFITLIYGYIFSGGRLLENKTKPNQSQKKNKIKIIK